MAITPSQLTARLVTVTKGVSEAGARSVAAGVGQERYGMDPDVAADYAEDVVEHLFADAASDDPEDAEATVAAGSMRIRATGPRKPRNPVLLPRRRRVTRTETRSGTSSRRRPPENRANPRRGLRSMTSSASDRDLQQAHHDTFQI